MLGFEGLLELDERESGCLGVCGPDLVAEPDPAGKRCTLLGELRCDRADLPNRDRLCKIPLQVAASPRGLLRMQPMQHERSLDAVALRDGEESRPEVVVLGLAERRVVPQPVLLEQVAPEHDRVVEHRGAEERSPAQRGAAGVVEMELARLSVRRDVEEARSHEAEIRPRVEKREAPLEPVRKGRIVGVHARDVAAAGFVERAVQRACEPELLVVAKHVRRR